MTNVQPYLQKIVDRFNNPGIQSGMQGFTRLLLFRFTDSREDWLIRVVDGKDAALEKDTSSNPDVSITTTTEVLSGVMDRKINGITAYLTHKIQIKGSMDDLMKIQKVMF